MPPRPTRWRVPPELIAAHGAVSREVAEAMARGALVHSTAALAVAVTGIAGPGGATPGKPVGTVWLAVARRLVAGVGDGGDDTAPASSVDAEVHVFPGDRGEVRARTVVRALELLSREAHGYPH